jgi:hypothetical protein
MKEVITKAIKKAQSRGYGIEDTVETVLDYLDIAGYAMGDYVDDDKGITYIPTKPSQVQPIIADSSTITAPAQVNRIIVKANVEDLPVWTPESLHAQLMGLDWAFSALPEGFKAPLEYKGSLVLNPKGQAGVGVVFTCPDVHTPREFNMFFGLNEKSIDPKARIEEVKSQVEQLFRVRNTPIANSNKPLTSFPSIDAIINGGGAVFGGEV